MKKLISIMLALVLMLSCSALIACGGGDDNTPEQTKQNQQDNSTPKPASGSFTWDDIPLYPGASDAEKFSMTIPGAETGEYERIEWRYYTTNDSVDDVISFYADEMPDNGWAEMATMSMGETSWSFWSQNNEETGAFIGVMQDDGHTILWMWRGEGLVSGDDEDDSIPTSTPTKTQSSDSGTGDLNWDDVPVYPGASQAEEFSMTIPGAETGDYEKIEWRYYETGDSVDNVDSFYADKMPDNGWEETISMNMGEVSWSFWSKDTGDTGAYIAVINDDGQTNIMMWKGMGID